VIQRYDVVRHRFGGDFPQPSPEKIGHCQFASFDADWTPRLVGERGAPLPDGEGQCTRALRRLAREFKITWGPLWARLIVDFAAGIGRARGPPPRFIPVPPAVVCARPKLPGRSGRNGMLG
jgi:hypothetical protein